MFQTGKQRLTELEGSLKVVQLLSDIDLKTCILIKISGSTQNCKGQYYLKVYKKATWENNILDVVGTTAEGEEKNPNRLPFPYLQHLLSSQTNGWGSSRPLALPQGSSHSVVFRSQHSILVSLLARK